MESDLPAVVIDNGSGLCKAGFAGGGSPCSIFTSIAGRQLDPKGKPAKNKDDIFVGTAAQSKRELMSIKYPIERGIITDWEFMEKIWLHTFVNELKVAPEDRCLLLTQSPFNPIGNMEKTAEIMFETFKTPALCLANQAILSMMAAGSTTGIVLESGDGFTQIVPLYEFCTLPHANIQLDIGGRDLTDKLMEMLGESVHPLSSVEVSEIKEKFCYVASDYQQSMKELSSQKTSYQLSDGRAVSFRGYEQFHCPEGLFQPSLLGKCLPGIHEAVYKSIMACDVDIRKELYGRITVSGGNTLFPGTLERLEKELSCIAHQSTKIKISAPPERKYTVWLGGSHFASSSTFPQNCTYKGEYDESGPQSIHKKTS